jgi:hypothetical protein
MGDNSISEKSLKAQTMERADLVMMERGVGLAQLNKVTDGAGKSEVYTRL